MTSIYSSIQEQRAFEPVSDQCKKSIRSAACTAISVSLVAPCSAVTAKHRPITLFYHKMIAWIQYKRKTRKERNKNKEAQTENVRLTPVIYQLAKKNRTHSRLLKCLAVGYYWTVSTFTPLPHNSQAFSLFFSLAFMFHTIAMQHIAPHTQLLYITCS